MRIAFGDIPSVESLYFLIAVERTKEKGVPVEMMFVKSEDIAAQAVLGSQADIGVGTPYAMLQKVRAPLKLFYQMSTLQVLPGGEHGILQDLEGPRRAGGRRSTRAAPAPKPS